MSSNKQTMIVLKIVVLAALAGVHTANADTIVPIDQQRSVSAFVIVPHCLADDSDLAEADGFEPFDGLAEAGVGCTLAGGFASSTQQSQIAASSLIASGSSTSDASAGVSNTIHAIAESLFEVTFQVNVTGQFTVEGTLNTTAFGTPIVVLSGANLKLTGPGNEIIFEHAVNPESEGQPIVENVEESGVLEPGIYTVRAEAATVIDNDVPPSLIAEASFDFTFEASSACLADLDQDAVVGAGDLADLLAAWGPNPDAPADFNGDGDVDAADLAELLSVWGACS